MKKLGISLSTLAVLWLFAGCSSKEFQTTNYFDALTKDEVLSAGRLVFLNEGNYIIDSYRDRVEVTKIGMVFHTLKHEDIVLNVQENECGTNATLKMTGNYGVDKAFNHDAFELEHKLFWYKVKTILEEKHALQETVNHENNETQSEVKPELTSQKDLTNCVIRTEFENGVIQNKTSSIGEIEYEAL
jgi:hypothetical protein